MNYNCRYYNCRYNSKCCYETINDGNVMVRVYDPTGYLICTGVETDGRMEGEWVWYYKSTIISRGTYHNGEREGVWRWWYKNGTERMVSGYSSGIKDGQYIF
jgi:antitoxin component YwqK of YwqJK toxin-antitoxin module